MAKELSAREKAAARREQHVKALEQELAGVKTVDGSDERAKAIQDEIKRVKNAKDSTSPSGRQQTRG